MTNEELERMRQLVQRADELTALREKLSAADPHKAGHRANLVISNTGEALLEDETLKTVIGKGRIRWLEEIEQELAAMEMETDE